MAFFAGWVIGSLSVYSYLVLTAKQPPYPECMACDSASCEGCEVLSSDNTEEFRMAA